MKFWSQLLNVGTTNTDGFADLQQTRISNAIYIVSGISALLIALNLVRLGSQFHGLINLLTTAVYFSSFLLNRARRFQTARWVFLVCVALGIFFNHSVIGQAGGFNFYLLNLSQAGYILFGTKDRKSVFIVSILSFGLFLLSFLGWRISLGDKELPVTVVRREFFYMNGISSFLIFVYVAYHFVATAQQSLSQAEESYRQADAANKAKSVFLSNMSHELRTPLNAIRGFAELLLSSGANANPETDPEKQIRHLRHISRAAEHLGYIIDDLLDLARIEAGRMTFKSEPFNLAFLVEDAMNVATHARPPQLTVTASYEIEANVPPVLSGDATRLSQILVNLLTNAFKFTRYGSVLLHIGAGQVTDNEVEIVIIVKDTGIGIPEANLHSLFQSFSGQSATTAVQYGGTGLGLAITRHLVEMQGGTISVESAVHKGSTFWVHMPFKISGEAPAKDKQTSHNLAGLRVLVAEDNPVNAELISAMLTSWQAHHQVVEDGIQLLSALENADFDVILMDVQMPRLNGLEATRAVRALADTRKARLPIIALTADLHADTRLSLTLAGIDDILAKPVVQKALFERLRAVISPKPQD